MFDIDIILVKDNLIKLSKTKHTFLLSNFANMKNILNEIQIIQQFTNLKILKSKKRHLQIYIAFDFNEVSCKCMVKFPAIDNYWDGRAYTYYRDS